MNNQPILLHLNTDEYALMFWEVVGEYRLNEKLMELRRNPQWGWRGSIKSLQGTWELLRTGNAADIQGILPERLQQMRQLGLLKQYSARWMAAAFADISTDFASLQGFTAPPDTPCLYAADNQPHYLHLSCEKNEILLQAWIYCDFDERRFRAATSEVWRQYRQWTKFECGYAGESEKFAAALRKSMDSSTQDTTP